MHMCSVTSFMSDSLWPHGLQTARLVHPWDFPSKNIRVGCHALPPGDLPNPGIEFMSPVSLALQADSLPLSCWGSPPNMLNKYNSINKFALGSLILKELINYSLREEYTGFNTYLKKQILETSIQKCILLYICMYNSVQGFQNSNYLRRQRWWNFLAPNYGSHKFLFVCQSEDGT